MNCLFCGGEFAAVRKDQKFCCKEHGEKARKIKDREKRKIAEYNKYWKDPESARKKGRERRKKWRLENPEKAREKKRQEYWKNPEKSRKRALDWSRKNAALLRENAKEWYYRHREKALAQARERYRKNPDRMRAQRRKNYEKRADLVAVARLLLKQAAQEGLYRD